MKLTPCSGVAASRSHTTPSAIAMLGRWVGWTTETRFEYSDGRHAWTGSTCPFGAASGATATAAPLTLRRRHDFRAGFLLEQLVHGDVEQPGERVQRGH